MVKLTIGEQVLGEKVGTTTLEAAKKAGLYTPPCGLLWYRSASGHECHPKQ